MLSSFDANNNTQLLSPTAARVWEVLQCYFLGSQSEMARQLGMTQPAISLVVTGKREPGPRLLNAIARLPGVSADWISSGKGTLPERQAVRDPRRCFLPLYASLHDAFPSRNQLGPTIHGVNVRAADFSESRIVLELSEAREWGDAKNCPLRPGCCLIFETDRRFWAAEPYKLEGRYAVRFSADQAPDRGELVYVRRLESLLKPGNTTAYVKRLWHGTSATPQSDAELSLATSVQKFFAEYGKYARCVRVDSESDSGTHQPPRPRVRRRELVPVSVEDIVAIDVAEFRCR
jgi:transcriptional regulator with XRE-family HTH domain